MQLPRNSEVTIETEISPEVVELYGDPGGSRTPNPQIRSLMLYPVELRGRSLDSIPYELQLLAVDWM